jgi:hypothetical protein
MSLKLRALIQTVGLIALAIACSATIGFIAANVSTETILQALGFGALAWFVYLFYSITLSRLEYQEKLKEIVDINKVDR